MFMWDSYVCDRPLSFPGCYSRVNSGRNLSHSHTSFQPRRGWYPAAIPYHCKKRSDVAILLRKTVRYSTQIIRKKLTAHNSLLKVDD